MFNSVIEDIKREYNYGNMVTRLIILNIAIFLAVNTMMLGFRLFNAWELPGIYNDIVHFFCISSDWWHNLTHPWVLFTSMVLHEGLWHILWNMLFLYWFGTIVRDFLGNHRILPIYILSGLAGGLIYFATANVFGYAGGNSFALGASGAVMGLVVAAGTIAPDYTMRLLFIGDVKLKYISLVVVLLDVIGLANNSNTGGHFAHLGGAAMGFFFVRQLQAGNDLGVIVQKSYDWIIGLFSPKQKKRRGPTVAYKNPKLKERRNNIPSRVSDQSGDNTQEKIDAILEKIKRKGMDSLTKEENDFLNNASKEIKK